MKGEEAIKRLKEFDMALEAIEALKAEPTGDLISRQAAIRWVKTECNPYGKPTLDFESGKKVIEHLRQLPSAEPVHGEWVKTYGGHFTRALCSVCGYSNGRKFNDNFCPNCGCAMTKE